MLCNSPHTEVPAGLGKETSKIFPYTHTHSHKSRRSCCPHTGIHKKQRRTCAHRNRHMQKHTPTLAHTLAFTRGWISVLGAYIRGSGRLKAISGPEKTQVCVFVYGYSTRMDFLLVLLYEYRPTLRSINTLIQWGFVSSQV